MSGDYAVVGVYKNNDNGSSSGLAYIYESVADLSLLIELTSFAACVKRSCPVVLEWVAGDGR
ncbi:MAG: hypothetical protein IIB44_03665 [Candidatus Marinimicrobia bacterium]|nr:hypothetical protein [Candidatus Neomarinimicrobiota bacterium]MCH8068347.1 hypothetical protein [Candidatus Neomarinimicrobiota bacterium]